MDATLLMHATDVSSDSLLEVSHIRRTVYVQAYDRFDEIRRKGGDRIMVSGGTSSAAVM